MPENRSVLQNHRFSNIVRSANQRCNDPINYDTILLKTSDFVVVPTRGSIVPNWVLVIPINSAINMQAAFQESGCPPLLMLQRIADNLGVSASEMIWFEHGASVLNSQTGCGVDYAHLHVLLVPSFNFSDFKSETFDAHQHEWSETKSHEVYETIAPNTDYYIFGCGDVAFVERTGRSLGSQFFRKIVANLTGKNSAWNYKTHEFDENVSKTIALFHADRKVAA
jgi:ATP adenylyltransferase